MSKKLMSELPNSRLFQVGQMSELSNFLKEDIERVSSDQFF